MQDISGPIVGETDSVIGYPAVEAAVATKQRLAQGLGRLVADAGEILHGVIAGPRVGNTDLDNSLLYNVGGSIAKATRYGVCLERETGTGLTRYSYRVAAATSLHAPGEVELVQWPAIGLSRMPSDWTEVWQALRGSDVIEANSRSWTGPIWVDVTIGTTSRLGCANATLVKAIVDGVLTALHDSEQLVDDQQILDRLAARTRLPRAAVRSLVLRNDNALLGYTPGLLVLRGTGVQCRPADGRVGWLRILIKRDAGINFISGRLGSLEISATGA
jgi:hypothetical protein